VPIISCQRKIVFSFIAPLTSHQDSAPRPSGAQLLNPKTGLNNRTIHKNQINPNYTTMGQLLKSNITATPATVNFLPKYLNFFLQQVKVITTANSVAGDIAEKHTCHVTSSEFAKHSHQTCQSASSPHPEVHVHDLDILDAFHLFPATRSSAVQTAWMLPAAQLQHAIKRMNLPLIAKCTWFSSKLMQFTAVNTFPRL